jgi:hypothetical protein
MSAIEMAGRDQGPEHAAITIDVEEFPVILLYLNPKKMKEKSSCS